MSQERAELVRQQIAFKPRTHRAMEERLLVRFPRLFGWTRQWLTRLPPRSRLRQMSVRKLTQMGYAATNREDFQVAFAAHHPQVEMIPDQQLTRLGFDDIYRGVDGRIRFQLRWLSDWGDWEFVPEEVIDFGDRLFVSGRMAGSGRASGAGIGTYGATLFTLDKGRVTREQFFFDPARALEAAGLSE
jgi:ketosteroid isomerase-like protein